MISTKYTYPSPILLGWSMMIDLQLTGSLFQILIIIHVSHCSFWFGHNNRKTLHSPLIRLRARLATAREIREIGRKIFTEYDLQVYAEDLWLDTVGVTTKAQVDEVCLLTFSVHL